MSKHRKTIYTSWSMPDPATNYVPLPKGIYRIGLSGEEISIYGYLFSLENENYQCWPSYKTIGKAVSMSKRTVMKYIAMLEEKCLIRVEHTEVIRKDGLKYNGTLRYTIRPFRDAEDYYNRQQVAKLEQDTEKWRVQKELERRGVEFTPAGDTAS